MLNYIWLSLIAFGILIALGSDIENEINKTFPNNEKLNAEIITHRNSFEVRFSAKNENTKFKAGKDFSLFVKNAQPRMNAYFTGTIEDAPSIIKQIAENSGEKDDVGFRISELQSLGDSAYSARVVLESVSFPKMKAITNAVLDYSKISVNIALGLIGIMAFWLGIMKIAERAGMVKLIAKAVRPLMRKLFPDVPDDHPAIASMIMNISANMLGLGNAATPFGLKAMEELDTLNTEKGTATNAMCTFLAINTAGFTLIPATAIAIRAAQGSAEPTIIIGTSLFGSLVATVTGITVAKFFERISLVKSGKMKISPKHFLKTFFFFALFIFLLALIVKFLFLSDAAQTVIAIIKTISILAIPLILLVFLAYGVKKKINLYEAFTNGAKEGFDIAVRIIPYLVAMLVAIGVFRASGGMDFLVRILSPVTNLIGMPAEVLPMALMRPLSGSGSIGIMTELMAQHGPDSFIGVLASTILGSTETTFYVLALYFGSVNIKRTRHAVIAGVSADIAGILAALFIVKLLFSF